MIYGDMITVYVFCFDIFFLVSFGFGRFVFVFRNFVYFSIISLNIIFYVKDVFSLVWEIIFLVDKLFYKERYIF